MDMYDIELCKKMNNKFLVKFGDYDPEKLLGIARYGVLSDFRLLCNALNRVGYAMESETLKSYDNRKLLYDACNNRVKEILGELLPCYMLIEIQMGRRHYWAADEKYQLFAYSIPATAYAILMQSTLILYHNYKQLTPENVIDVSDLLNGATFISRDLYPEKRLYSNNCGFGEKNHDRKLNVQAWIEFMDAIFYKDYDKAYKVRENTLLLYEKNSKKGTEDNESN